MNKVSFQTTAWRRFTERIFSKLLFCAAFMAIYTVSGIAHANLQDPNRVIQVGGDLNYPPYEFLDPDGNPAGYNVELTQAIAEVMGINVHIQLGDWGTMRQALESGEVDILQGISYTDERAQKYTFSPAHAYVHQSIFTRKGNPVIDDISDLKGKSVVVQRQGVMHDYFLDHNIGAELVLVDTHADAIRLLAAGKHDYALVANLPSLYLSQKLGISDIVLSGKAFEAQKYSYAVNKGNESLLAQFSEGLAILKNTGRYQEIYDKWLGPLEEQKFPWRKFGTAAITISLIILAIIVWNRALAREVERRSKELELRQQQLIQADKMTSLGILVSGVAHEINNPCGLLMLNIPILRDSYQDALTVLEEHYQTHGDFELGGLSYSRMREEIPAMLDEMFAGVERIKRIVDDLGDFSRQDTSRITEEVDLNAITTAAIRLVDNTLRKSTESFHAELGHNLPTFKGNAQRIEQVIINLLVNACQALDDKSQKIELKTYFRESTQQLVLKVIDQGCGIPPENLSSLSDPFFTTKRETGGTGLGLSVSSGIVREHGGTLTFNSKIGEGTTVTLSLPIE